MFDGTYQRRYQAAESTVGLLELVGHGQGRGLYAQGVDSLDHLGVGGVPRQLVEQAVDAVQQNLLGFMIQGAKAGCAFVGQHVLEQMRGAAAVGWVRGGAGSNHHASGDARLLGVGAQVDRQTVVQGVNLDFKGRDHSASGLSESVPLRRR